MKRIEWPLLTAEDIEVRIATCKEGKTTLLLYQNSRTAMNAFDAMFGEFGWQCEYYDAGGQIYCKIGVYDEDRGEWIWKSDTGSESNIEAEKGFSSDAFKRTAVRFGYARELYTTPMIVIDNDNKWRKFKVKEIGYDGRKIARLVIADSYGNVVYTYGQPVQKGQDGVYIPQSVWDAICAAQTVAELANIWSTNANLQSSEKFKSKLGKKKAELKRPA